MVTDREQNQPLNTMLFGQRGMLLYRIEIFSPLVPAIVHITQSSLILHLPPSGWILSEHSSPINLDILLYPMKL